jgi:SAM-dependent methyltransferase
MELIAPKPVSVPVTLDLSSSDSNEHLDCQGFAGPEPHGRWTNRRDTRLGFVIDPARFGDVLMTIELAAFLAPPTLPEQRVAVSVNGVSCGVWTIRETGWHARPIILPELERERGEIISVGLIIPTCRAPVDVGTGPDIRLLGVIIRRLVFSAIPESPADLTPSSIAGSPPGSVPGAAISLLPGRLVGSIPGRTYNEKVMSGFWARYITGPLVLDIGCTGDDATGAPLDERAAELPIIEGAVRLDLDYPGYDGVTLPFPTESQDAVYSSHSLARIHDHLKAIQEWHRVVKVGGHIIVAVPHAHLFERRHRPPSRWNLDHARMYTTASLLAEFAAALRPNSYRVRHLNEDDRGYRYDDPPERHATGGYEIELVVEKIKEPAWSVED